MTVIKPVEDMDFWRRRLNQAHAEGRPVHAAIYDCSVDTWNRIQDQTKILLPKFFKPGQSVIDIGCGFGPVYDILPPDLRYTGIDISPDFIHIAQLRHPRGNFQVMDARDLSKFYRARVFDWGLIRSVEGMIIDNKGSTSWEQMKAEIQQVAKKFLYLDYDDPINVVVVE